MTDVHDRKPEAGLAGVGVQGDQHAAITAIGFPGEFARTLGNRRRIIASGDGDHQRLRGGAIGTGDGHAINPGIALAQPLQVTVGHIGPAVGAELELPQIPAQRDSGR